MALVKSNARSSSALDATILTGNLPAISGASLTGVASDFVKIQSFDVTSDTSSVEFNHGSNGVDFTGTTYRSHVIIFSDVHMKADNDRAYLQLQDSGGSYDNASNKYFENRHYSQNDGQSVLSGLESSLRITSGGTDDSRVYSTMEGVIELFNFNSSTNYSKVLYHTHISFIDSQSYAENSIGTHYRDSAVQTTGIRFKGGSNDIERGTFTLYSRK